MDIKDFRIAHSTLIEHYQFIEAHLEGIYAAVSNKPFLDGLREIEKDSLGGVVRVLRQLEREKGFSILSEEEYTDLRQIIERRNFWCHCCYFELSFDREGGGLARVRDVQTLIQDTENAEAWRERLRIKKIELVKKMDRGNLR